MPKYEKCPELAELINLWLVFAGDGETWREVRKHIEICDQCQLNIELSEIRKEQWITDHTSEVQPGAPEPKPESELTGINAVYAAISETWKRTISPMTA